MLLQLILLSYTKYGERSANVLQLLKNHLQYLSC